LSENDLDKDVLAGEIGFIKKIEQDAKSLSISFGGKTVSFHFDELDYMNLAYALPASQACFVTAKAVVMCVEDISKHKKVISGCISRVSDLAVMLSVGPNQ